LGADPSSSAQLAIIDHLVERLRQSQLANSTFRCSTLPTGSTPSWAAFLCLLNQASLIRATGKALFVETWFT
jgi:hypothetical protein